jgi:hypothetical protein
VLEASGFIEDGLEVIYENKTRKFSGADAPLVLMKQAPVPAAGAAEHIPGWQERCAK